MIYSQTNTTETSHHLYKYRSSSRDTISIIIFIRYGDPLNRAPVTIPIMNNFICGTREHSPTELIFEF